MLRLPWAGVAICLGLLAPGVAIAADLRMPEPMIAEPEPIPEEVGSNWYLRGDIGFVRPRKPDARSYNMVPNNVSLDAEDIRDTYSVGAGVGYKLNSWLRFDVTGDYRRSSTFTGSSSQSGYVAGFSPDKAKVQANSLMVNAYLDLGTWAGFTPYVGAGVGVGMLTVRNYDSNVFYNPGFGPPGGTVCAGPGPCFAGSERFAKKTTYDLAWALMAGASYQVMPGFLVDAGYRYIDLGDAETGLGPSGIGTKIRNVTAHEVRVGIRYQLD